MPKRFASRELQKMTPRPPSRDRPVRHPHELAGDEFEMVFDQSEVGSRVIGLAQRQGVFV